MSKLSSVLKKTGIAVAAAAMLVTMGAGTVVTQAKTSLPVYKVSLAKKYTNNQKGKQMEASVKIPKVKITGTDGKVMKSESEKLNAAISSYQNKFIKDYKKDVAAIKKGEKGNESLTSGYKVVTDNDKLFCLRIDTVIAMGGSQSYAKIFSVDKKSGKQITLKNLFKKGSGYIDRISDNIKEQMRAQMKENADVTYFVDDENNKFNFKSISNKTNFYVNEKGKLTLVFDKYEVAPGYMGMVEFSIPTGEIRSVEGTPMDFRTPHTVGERINDKFQQLIYGAGYDHCYVLNKAETGSLDLAATCKEPNSGRIMEVYTTEAGVQLYTGNWLGGFEGTNGATFPARSAICFEAQCFPDTPNKAHFPSATLLPGDEYQQVTIYKFGVEK